MDAIAPFGGVGVVVAQGDVTIQPDVLSGQSRSGGRRRSGRIGHGFGTDAGRRRDALELGADRRQLELERGQGPLTLLALRLEVLPLLMDLGMQLLELPVQRLATLCPGLRVPLDLLQRLVETRGLGLVAPLGLLELVAGGGPLRTLLAQGVELMTEPHGFVLVHRARLVDLPPGLLEQFLPALLLGLDARLFLAPLPLGLLDQIFPLLHPSLPHGLALGLPVASGLFEPPGQDVLSRLELGAEDLYLLLEPIAVGAQGLAFLGQRSGG